MTAAMELALGDRVQLAVQRREQSVRGLWVAGIRRVHKLSDRRVHAPWTFQSSQRSDGMTSRNNIRLAGRAVKVVTT